LVQCKRERQIGPTQLRRYVEAIPTEPLYGVIFAAACDFSKKARDAFDAACRERGFSEAHLWGRGEIEDKLFLPKNDHLLFAYFGISLVIRRRSLQSQLRAIAATKKSVRRVLKSQQVHTLVIRTSDSEYPELPDPRRPSWVVVTASDVEFHHEGLVVEFRSFFAYLGDDGKSWDAANQSGLQRSEFHSGQWGRRDPHPLSEDAREAWDALEQQNKAWMNLSGLIPYTSILAIDEVGDEYFSGPIVYVAAPSDRLFDLAAAHIEPVDKFTWGWAPCDPALRVEKFPSATRFVPPSMKDEAPASDQSTSAPR
jgi:hypothetical protein